MLILILSIFGSRLVKYRFYNPMNIINEFIMFIKIMISFCTEIVFNFFIRTKDIIVYLAKKLYKYVLSFFK